MNGKQVTGTTFTSPDPEDQRISGTRSASGRSRGTRNLSAEVRAQRTFTDGAGLVPSVDLSMATRSGRK